jgi:hypothetical protein
MFSALEIGSAARISTLTAVARKSATAWPRTLQKNRRTLFFLFFFTLMGSPGMQGCPRNDGAAQRQNDNFVTKN